MVADREFIGNDWFDYLNARQIKFVVRIKSNMLLNNGNKLVKARNVFGSVRVGKSVSKRVTIEGISLSAQATKSKDNELVIVVSNCLTQPKLLPIYAKRWRIECLFANCKTRGFNFEDTHITIPDKIGNLTKLVVIAFAICYLVGLIRASVQPLMVKNHGYKQHSYFRYGYDYMIQSFSQSFYKAISLIILCFSNFTLEAKCKKIISVM